MYNQSATSTVTGGGICAVNDAIITDNTIINNSIYHGANGQAVGGGIECSFAKFIIKNNIIKGNVAENTGDDHQPDGGGIFGQEMQDGTLISGNLIESNKTIGYLAWGGGIGIWDNAGKINIGKNVIINNEAVRGGGIYLANVNSDKINSIGTTGRIIDKYVEHKRSKSILPVIANNTIIENFSNNGGSIAVRYFPGHILVFNNIIYDNTAVNQANEIYLVTNAYAYLYHNDINTEEIGGNGLWEGSDNIFADPQFIDPGNGDFHLLTSSPCICQAVDSLEILETTYYCPVFDIDNNQRPAPQTGNHRFPDIGAFEEQTIECTYQGYEESVDLTFGISIYPNPCSGTACLQFKINNQQLTILNLYDITGAKIKRLFNEEKMAGEYEIEIDVTGLPAGVYFCTLKTNEGTQTVKLIKL